MLPWRMSSSAPAARYSRRTRRAVGGLAHRRRRRQPVGGHRPAQLDQLGARQRLVGGAGTQLGKLRHRAVAREIVGVPSVGGGEHVTQPAQLEVARGARATASAASPSVRSGATHHGGVAAQLGGIATRGRRGVTDDLHRPATASGVRNGCRITPSNTDRPAPGPWGRPRRGPSAAVRRRAAAAIEAPESCRPVRGSSPSRRPTAGAGCRRCRPTTRWWATVLRRPSNAMRPIDPSPSTNRSPLRACNV